MDAGLLCALALVGAAAIVAWFFLPTTPKVIEVLPTPTVELEPRRPAKLRRALGRIRLSRRAS
jgi:hypothetical protein